MALTDSQLRQTQGGINVWHSLISQAMQSFLVLCVIVAVVVLSIRGDMDKATAGSLLGIVLGHTGTAVAANLRSRHTDIPTSNTRE